MHHKNLFTIQTIRAQIPSSAHLEELAAAVAEQLVQADLHLERLPVVLEDALLRRGSKIVLDGEKTNSERKMKKKKKLRWKRVKMYLVVLRDEVHLLLRHRRDDVGQRDVLEALVLADVVVCK